MFSLVLKIHIAAAVLSALCFWLPIAVAKGGNAHKKLGFVYVFLLFVTSTTAIALLILTSDATARPATARMPLDHYAGDPVLYRAFQGFLGYVAFATFSAAITGLQALKHRARAVLAQTVFHGLVAVGGLAVVLQGFRHGVTPMIAVGAAGALLGVCSIKVARTLERDRNARWNGHILGMIASGIGAYSALAIVLANRMAPEFFHGEAGVVVWLIPATIGVPAMLWAMKRYAARGDA
ncbi:MAG: hypothetical protein JNL94_17795 [Planctomycetes bacterium]|nr:hypothetical protein [Planctomycetota bacterium]